MIVNYQLSRPGQKDLRRNILQFKVDCWNVSIVENTFLKVKTDKRVM